MRHNKNNKQKPPNTLLSSQTTHPFRPRTDPAANSHVLEVRTFGNPTEVGASLWEPPRSSGQGPCRSDSDKLREG
jgi:hypothetical protein